MCWNVNALPEILRNEGIGLEYQELKTLIEQVAAQVLAQKTDALTIPVEMSARHVHLSREHLNILFGDGYQLTPVRDLSQPGQFLAQEKVSVITPKGEFAKVSILGPVRKRSQVELSQNDARTLGLTPPLRLSGDLNGSAGCILLTDKGMVALSEGVIVVQNHIHMTACDAQRFGVHDMQEVRAQVQTARPLTFERVLIRVSEASQLAFHIDVDEANACALGKHDVAVIRN